MSTDGSQGVAYRLPVGTAVSFAVVNERSMGGTNLGFAGQVACRIEAYTTTSCTEQYAPVHSYRPQLQQSIARSQALWITLPLGSFQQASMKCTVLFGKIPPKNENEWNNNGRGRPVAAGEL